MKLAVLTTSYPANDKDYSGIFIKNFLINLPTSIESITVCTPHKQDSSPDEKDGRIMIKRFSYWLPSSRELLLRPGGLLVNVQKSLLAKIQLIPFAFFSLIHACKHARKQDIIHAHWILYSIVARILNFLFHTPYIITVHGTDIEVMKNNIFLRMVMKSVFKHSNHVISVSDYLKNEVLKISPNATVHVYPNGIGNAEKLFKINRKKTTTKDPALLWIGRFSKEKNLHLLLEIIRNIKKKIPNIKLNLVGSGPQKEEIEYLIKKFKLHNSITLTGPIPPNDIHEYYKKADIFILPSQREGFGVVVIEAMASGIPVIASNVGGVPDIVKENKNGFLCEPTNSQDFIKAITTLYSDSELRFDMGQKGRVMVREKFTWDKIAENINRNIYTKNNG